MAPVCYLLQTGEERNVTLSHATDQAIGRRRALHVNVQLGEPGTGEYIEIGVAGTPSDPGYVAPTPVDPDDENLP